ncbi:hypothetical protein GQ42DRAFT_164740 [Ramicandelaber brevisporus]|nr:hypothetical protein GQ42DRAFT_164740 [Ramicandelaber brevisporus]
MPQGEPPLPLSLMRLRSNGLQRTISAVSDLEEGEVKSPRRPSTANGATNGVMATSLGGSGGGGGVGLEPVSPEDVLQYPLCSMSRISDIVAFGRAALDELVEKTALPIDHL